MAFTNQINLAFDNPTKFGHPYHGLWTLENPSSYENHYGNVMPLIGTAPAAGNSGTESGYTFVVQGPKAKAVDTTTEEAANGELWTSFAVMSGGNHRLYGKDLGRDSWIYFDDNGQAWLAKLVATASTNASGSVGFVGHVEFKKFGQFGGVTEADNVVDISDETTISITFTPKTVVSRAATAATGTFESGLSVTTNTNAPWLIEDIWKDGSKAIISIYGTPGSQYYAGYSNSHPNLVYYGVIECYITGNPNDELNPVNVDFIAIRTPEETISSYYFTEEIISRYVISVYWELQSGSGGSYSKVSGGPVYIDSMVYNLGDTISFNTLNHTDPLPIGSLPLPQGYSLPNLPQGYDFRWKWIGKSSSTNSVYNVSLGGIEDSRTFIGTAKYYFGSRYDENGFVSDLKIEIDCEYTIAGNFTIIPSHASSGTAIDIEGTKLNNVKVKLKTFNGALKEERDFLRTVYSEANRGSYNSSTYRYAMNGNITRQTTGQSFTSISDGNTTTAVGFVNGSISNVPFTYNNYYFTFLFRFAGIKFSNSVIGYSFAESTYTYSYGKAFGPSSSINTEDTVVDGNTLTYIKKNGSYNPINGDVYIQNLNCSYI